MTRCTLLLSAAAAVTALPACRQYPPPAAGFGDAYPAPLNDPQIVVLEPELRPWLAFQPAALLREPPRPMSVEVPVRNLADRQYNLEYRFRFFDEHDLEVGPTMRWTALAILPNQIARLAGSAMAPEAVSYRLEVKWAG